MDTAERISPEILLIDADSYLSHIKTSESAVRVSNGRRLASVQVERREVCVGSRRPGLLVASPGARGFPPLLADKGSGEVRSFASLLRLYFSSLCRWRCVYVCVCVCVRARACMLTALDCLI